MRVWVAAGLVIAFANTADARQEAWVEVGGGAGYARSLHGDLGFGEAAVSGTARVHVSPHVAIEGQAGFWQHADRDIFAGVGGERVETRIRRRFPSVTAALLAHGGSGARIAPYGGGGLGLFYHLSRYDQGATSESPAYSSSNGRVSVGATLVGGSDVRLSRRVKAFGEFRFDVQSLRDPGSSSYRVLGGLRLKVR